MEKIATVSIFDTETTGLAKAIGAELSTQPYIIEHCFVKADIFSDGENFKMRKVDEIKGLIKPAIPIPEYVTKHVHGITDEMVENSPSFADEHELISNFHVGVTHFCAHNLAFDLKMMEIEYSRLGKVNQFPWPPNRICTMLATKQITGKNLKLTKLHEMATGKPHDDKAHRADEDVYALARVLKWAIKEGYVTF